MVVVLTLAHEPIAQQCGHEKGKGPRNRTSLFRCLVGCVWDAVNPLLAWVCVAPVGSMCSRFEGLAEELWSIYSERIIHRNQSINQSFITTPQTIRPVFKKIIPKFIMGKYTTVHNDPQGVGDARREFLMYIRISIN